LKKYPEWLVIDVGANIGQYTLFAAKMGNKVVAVEPFHDNILRIHKASQLEKTYDRITLITNAISNKRNEIKMLNKEEENIGRQTLYEKRNQLFEKNSTNKYLVETILFDDIVPYLPLKNVETNEKFEKAVLKIDIESFEIFAFEHASLLFDTLDIKYIFMEWVLIATKVSNDYENKVIALIDFFYERDYEPLGDNNKLLERKNWKTWTTDILWIRF